MKKKICMILIAVFVAVLGTSTYFIIDHYKESNKQAALYGELAELVDAAAQTDAATEPAEQIPYSEEKMLLPELAELYQQNGDLVGWISICLARNCWWIKIVPSLMPFSKRRRKAPSTQPWQNCHLPKLT